MIAYFLKINVAIVLFYLFYRLFFRKDTFFAWRRTALLGFFAASAAMPLLDIRTWVTAQLPMAAMADFYASVVLPELTVAPEPMGRDLSLTDILCLVYGLGVLGLTLRFLVQLIGIVRLARRCPTQEMNGVWVHRLPRPEGPFSFFRWIFIHPASHSEGELDEILTHECTHVRQWHSLDVVIGELVCIVCWFNPAVWLMKQEIRTNLEYMADEQVLETGYDSKAYQYHLLGLSHHKAAATIYNNFNVLPLKMRIMMMNKRRTRKIGRTKYLMFLPLAALLMIVSNIETVARTTKKLATEVMDTAVSVMPIPLQEEQGTVTYKGKVIDKDGNPIKGVRIYGDYKYKAGEAESAADGSFTYKIDREAVVVFFWAQSDRYQLKTTKDLDTSQPENLIVRMDGQWKEYADSRVPDDSKRTIYEVVEQMPRFPNGGMPGLMKYLQDNIRYPEAAKQAGTQGRVTVLFVVETDGSISNVKILRGVSPELDEEAIRVISAMPKWEPGMQRGQAVAVKYTVPVMFRLPKETKPYAPVDKVGEVVVVGIPKDEAKVDGEVLDVAEKMPEFPGGMSGLMQYLSQNIKYPAEARKNGTQGRVVVEVVINTEGRATHAKVTRSVGPSLDAEALRVINDMPAWKPGTKDGKPVNVKFSVPIMFRL